MPWFGTPFTTSSQETEQALFLEPRGQHMALMQKEQNDFNPFNISCSKLLLFKGFSTIMI